MLKDIKSVAYFIFSSSEFHNFVPLAKTTLFVLFCFVLFFVFVLSIMVQA